MIFLDQQTQIPPEVQNFLEGLLTDSGMQFTDEAMKAEMTKELYARLDNYLTSVIIDNMPPEHLDEFIKINEAKKSREEIEGFLKEKMPNSADIFAKAFGDFREMYLGNVTVARNAPPAGGLAT